MELTGKTVNGRFRIGEMIAAGRLFSRYGAADLENDGLQVEVIFIAPETMSRRPEDLIRFRAAVRAAAGLSHANILRVHEAGEFFQHGYVVTEKAGGAPLAGIMGGGSLSIAKSVAMAKDIAAGLEFIHAAGIMHRCLTPTMVLAENPVKLTGLGIAHILEFPDILPREDVEETLCYLSPEQCGLLKRPVDERSDLYSAGVILYRLLTGALPFHGEDAWSLANLQLAGSPEDPRRRNPGIPGVLGAITLKLLEREPDNRYQSAAGLIHDLDRFTEGGGDFVPGLNDRSARLSFRTRLVGRGEELDRLKTLYRDACAGRGSFILVTGKAGSGKTRLAEELKDYARADGGVFSAGKCHREEINFPYSPVREALGDCARIILGKNESQREAAISALKREFGSMGSIVTGVHPGFAEILGAGPRVSQLEPESEMKRFLMVLGRFIIGLSRLEKGMVLLVDDLQWADTGSRNLLIEMLDQLPRSRLLVIGTHREEDLAASSDFIGRIDAHPSCARMDLGTLDESATRALVAGILSENDSGSGGAADIIHRNSQGNPFIAITLLKHLVESGSLRYEKRAWHLAPSGGDDIPRSLVDIIVERINELSDREKDVISCAAVIGKEFDFSLLSRLSDLSGEELVGILDRARSLQIFGDSPRGGGTLTFVHDRIMEAFAEKIDMTRRRELHLRIASALEALHGNAIDAALFDLAHHSIEGGDTERAIQYAFPAGVKSRENHAHRDALRYFRETAALLEKTGAGKSQLMVDCVMEMGFICATIGEYDETISLLSGILPQVGGTSLEPRAHLAICNAYYRRGDWGKCEEHAALGLALLGDRLPRTKAGAVAGVIKELAAHYIHVLLPRFFVREDPGPVSERYRHIINFYEPLSMSYALNDPLKLVRADLRALNLAERRIGPSPELAMSLYAFGAVCMAVPLFPAARRYFGKALAMNTRLGHEWGSGKSLELLGYCSEWQGDFARARENFSRSIEIFTRIGDVKELAMALNGLQHCHYYTADYAPALETNDRYYELASRIKDHYSISAADIYYSQCLREKGDLEGAAAHAERALNLSSEKHIRFNCCSALNELGCHALETGNHTLAIQRLEEARALHEESVFLKQYIVPVYVNLAQAYLEDYQAREHAMKPAERAACLSKAAKASRRAVAKTKRWPTHHAGALRVTATCFALKGRHDRAEALYNRAINHARRHGRRFEEMRCLYEYGLLLFQKGQSGRSREMFEAAYQICGETGAGLYYGRISSLLGIKDTEKGTTPLERMMRKERMLSIKMFSYKIRSIPDPRELLDEVVARAMELAGARRGVLYMRTPAGKLEVRSSKNLVPDDPASVPEGILEKVFDKRKFEISAGKDGAQSLTVPVRSHYKVIGVCFLDMPRSPGTFSESDGEFIQDFMTDVGMAVENAMMQHRPDETPESERDALSSSTETKVRKAITYIDENYTSDISREGLAASLDINPDHLGKAFKSFTGEKISDYINRLRVQDASRRLVESEEKIIDIAFSVGFESLSTFNRAFMKEMSVTPQAFRKVNKG